MYQARAYNRFTGQIYIEAHVFTAQGRVDAKERVMRTKLLGVGDAPGLELNIERIG